MIVSGLENHEQNQQIHSMTNERVVKELVKNPAFLPTKHRLYKLKVSGF